MVGSTARVCVKEVFGEKMFFEIFNGNLKFKIELLVF